VGSWEPCNEPSAVIHFGNYHDHRGNWELGMKVCSVELDRDEDMARTANYVSDVERNWGGGGRQGETTPAGIST
jgi:hypothetical protein